MAIVKWHAYQASFTLGGSWVELHQCMQVACQSFRESRCQYEPQTAGRFKSDNDEEEPKMIKRMLKEES